MSGIDMLARPLRETLSRITDRIATRIAAEVPADVRVVAQEGGVLLSGRALSLRALTDARLRDFAVIARRVP